MAKHALLSPSSAHRWCNCPGSVALTKDLPNVSSPYAEEGTRAHRLAELALAYWREAERLTDGYGFAGDMSYAAARDKYFELRDKAGEEMDAAVGTYLQAIENKRPYSWLKVEERLDVSGITGEEGAAGTADCVMFKGDTLWIIDFKYGKGVRVAAEHNDQLSIYAIAAYDQLDFFAQAGVQQIGLQIVQPRIDHIDEWVFPVSEIEGMRARFKEAGAEALREARQYDEDHGTALQLNPSEGACRFCGVKASCPKLREQVTELVESQFEVLLPAEMPAAPEAIPVPQEIDELAKALKWVPLVRTWCDAVSDSALSKASAGEDIPGFKLVAGRAGPRQWDKAQLEQVTKLLKGGLRVADIYEKKLISPTSAEKLMKAGTLGEARWKKLGKFITRSEAKNALVPESDPRPALPKVESAFDVLQ